MMKYLYCLFLSALLMLGFSQILNHDVHKFRSKAGTMEIQSHPESDHHLSTTLIQQACKEYYDTKTEGYNCKKGYNCNTGDGISSNAFLSRNITPSKTLRFSASFSSIRIRCILDSKLRKNRTKGFTLDKPPVQFSYKYFVYTLKRILI